MHPVLKSLVPVVRMLGRLLGRDCEVVLHELSHPQTSVVAVENGQVTGRQVGDGIRDLFNTVLRSPRFEEDMLVNYPTRLPDGRTLRSGTVLIRDEAGKVIGALCINIDLTRVSAAKQLLDEQMTIEVGVPAGGTPDRAEEEEEAHRQDVLSILDALIGNALSEVGTGEVTNKDERAKLVRFLDERGAFRIKGAVDIVAHRLGVSRYTIYNYLNEVRACRGD